jgi:hypothetical protein
VLVGVLPLVLVVAPGLVTPPGESASEVADDVWAEVLFRLEPAAGIFSSTHHRAESEHVQARSSSAKVRLHLHNRSGVQLEGDIRSPPISGDVSVNQLVRVYYVVDRMGARS